MAKTRCSIGMRMSTSVANLIAVIVMGTSNVTVDTLEAKFSDSTHLIFFLIANCIATGYGLLVVFLPSGSGLWRIIVVLDAMIMLPIVSCSCAAAGVALYDMKNGNPHSICPCCAPICGPVPAFCDHVTAALVFGALGAALQFVLTFYSLHTIINPLLLPDSHP